ncbi:MAG: hypothetical protein ABEH83_07820 [Halobacterium sp.]
MPGDTEGGAGWYDTRWGRLFYWGILVATLVGVAASALVTGLKMQVAPAVYLFGFLGATVYVFTSFAKEFGRAGRYRLKILSRTVAVLPLAAGVYLLAMAFPGVEGDLDALAGAGSVSDADRLVAGLVFLAGIYVSATLKALGGLAERLLGVGSPRQNDGPARQESGPESAEETGASSEPSAESAATDAQMDSGSTGSETNAQAANAEADDVQSGDAEADDAQSEGER